MSIWCENQSNDSDHDSPSVRCPVKVDSMTKIHIIHAIDSGQSKTEVGRACGINTRAVTSIYNQKELIIQKYKEKYNLKDGGGELEKALLEWFHTEMKNCTIIHEEQLYKKAQEIIELSKNEFSCFDDWLQDFKLRHGIAKYKSVIECSKHEKDEWMKAIDGEDMCNYYIGGFTALAYSQTIMEYLTGCKSYNWVAVFYIVNLLGSDKKPLAVIGSEDCENEPIKSIPVEYYKHGSTEINYSTIVGYLNRWDEELKQTNKEVVLALSLPDNVLSSINLQRIKLISAIDTEFLTKVLEKVTESFKCNYRRLQITKDPTCNAQTKLFDAIHMMSLAWHSIPSKYILRLLYPHMEDSLLFNNSLCQHEVKYSLSEWCQIHSMPLASQYNSRTIDRFLNCEDNLQYMNMEQNLDNPSMYQNDVLENSDVSSSSGVEAYQAMKRLVAFLQGDSALQSTIQSAKVLENYTEYGALIEIQNFISSNKNE